MADVKFINKLAVRTRRYPVIHRPLKIIRRLVTKQIPVFLTDLLRVLAPTGRLQFGPPKGSFSIYNSLQYENRRPSRIVLHDQGVPEVSPDSLLVISNLKQHTCQPWPVLWSQHKNARLVASSLALLDERKRLCRESVYGDTCVEDDPAWRYFRLPKPVFLEGNWTSVVSRWCPNTGVPTFSHWIMDALPRLALLKEFPADTKIMVPAQLAGYQKESLQMLGLLDRVRYTPERHVIIENYYFSSPTSMISCYSPYSITWLRSTFLPYADKSCRTPKRFVLRHKGKVRGIKNESEVNDFFRRLGWEIVEAEAFTFAQKIQLFSNAEAIAGIFGGGFTSCIWSPPGCKVITFVPDCFVDGGVESHTIINRIDYYWQIFPSDHKMMATVDLGAIKQLLRKAGLDAG